MKKIILMAALAIASTGLVGCTYTSNYESGSKIEESNISKIVKGETTEAQLVAWFGQPLSKVVISETDSKWIYSHTVGSASAQAFTMKTNSNAQLSTLDILVRNGVVINYAFTKSPLNPMVSTSSSL